MPASAHALPILVVEGGGGGWGMGVIIYVKKRTDSNGEGDRRGGGETRVNMSRENTINPS